MNDELTLLKKQADVLGIRYSNNIGVDTLREKVKDALADRSEQDAESQEKAKEAKQSLKEKRNEAMKLVRIRVTNMNPAKKNVPGGIYTVGSKDIGIVRKYVPYHDTEEGYHVPNCIYERLKQITFKQHTTVKDRNVLGGERHESREVKEFAIEVLPPLTKEELQKLADDQKATGRV